MYFWVISCSSASFLCCFSFAHFKYFSFVSSWYCVLLFFLFLPPCYLSFLHSFLLMTSRRHASLLSLNQTCNSLQTWLWDAGCSGFLRCSERRWVGRNGHQHPLPPPRTHTYTHTCTGGLPAMGGWQAVWVSSGGCFPWALSPVEKSLNPTQEIIGLTSFFAGSSICQHRNGSSVSDFLQKWMPRRKELSEDLLMHRPPFSLLTPSARRSAG